MMESWKVLHVVAYYYYTFIHFVIYLLINLIYYIYIYSLLVKKFF